MPEGAGHSRGAGSQHSLVSLCPPPSFPRPPTAPSSPHLQILLCQSHPAEREGLSGASWGLHAENALVLLPGVPATTRKWEVPIVGAATLVRWKRRKVQALSRAVPWDPVPCSPRRDAGARWNYLCKPSLSSTESSLGRLSSGSSRVSASAGRQWGHRRPHVRGFPWPSLLPLPSCLGEG